MSTLSALVLGVFGIGRKQIEAVTTPPELPAAPVVRPVVPEAVPPRAAPVRREPRRVMATHILCDRFVKWMQAEGATGYWLVDEIDELREAFCDRFKLEIPGAYEFRSCLAVTQGVTRGKYRLKSWEFIEVARRTTMERPVLYRIHSKAVSETISSNFYGELGQARNGDDQSRMRSDDFRSGAGTHVGRKQKRAYPKQKRQLKPDVEMVPLHGNPVGNREIERKAAA